jgi:hypothetical protein
MKTFGSFLFMAKVTATLTAATPLHTLGVTSGRGDLRQFASPR